MSNLPDFVENIKKTGFVLEYQVSQLLRKHKWTVINNKYYIDDVSETIREIDVVAYKGRKVGDILFYTTLIVSCKKSEENVWALLSKQKDAKDPNIEWHPLHVWTNDKVLEFMLKTSAWESEYIARTKRKRLFNDIIDPATSIFAFQEMNRTTGKSKNDKNIFKAITSLMKAQGYELSSLEKRKKDKSLYQFNLISVIDSDLLQIFFDDQDIKAEEIEEAKYIGNYIINNIETSSRIQFIKYSALDSLLDKYDSLHEHNIEFYTGMHKEYFVHALEKIASADLFIEEFKKDFMLEIQDSIVSPKYGEKISDDSIHQLCLHEGVVRIVMSDVDDYTIEMLNSDRSVHEITNMLLNIYYRYRGKFVFEKGHTYIDIPKDTIPF